MSKSLSQSLFFNKVDGLKLAFFLKKRPADIHFCEFCKAFKSAYFGEHLRTAAIENWQVFILHWFMSFEVQSCLNQLVRAGNKRADHDK